MCVDCANLVISPLNVNINQFMPVKLLTGTPILVTSFIQIHLLESKNGGKMFLS